MSTSSFSLIRKLEQLISQVEKLKRQPASILGTCIVYRSVSQSIPNNASTAISFDTEVVDTAAMWSAGTTVTVPVDGIYLCHGVVRFESTMLATGVRQVGIFAGANLIGVQRIPAIAGEAVIIEATAIRDLTAGTQLTLQPRHTAGVAINVEFAAQYSPYFSVRRIA